MGWDGSRSGSPRRCSVGVGVGGSGSGGGEVVVVVVVVVGVGDGVVSQVPGRQVEGAGRGESKQRQRRSVRWGGAWGLGHAERSGQNGRRGRGW